MHNYNQQAVTKAVFPVAGLGTRFLPATKASPKEMLVVVDKPLIQYAVEDGFRFAYPCAPCIGKETSRDECNLSKIFNTADGVLFVFLDYNIESRMMGVAAGVTANITIALYDKKCDKVFKIRESGKSKGKVPAVLGVPVMKPEKIQPLCEDATEVLFKDLEGRLAKIIKKSGNL